MVNFAQRADFPYQLQQTPAGLRIRAVIYPGVSPDPLGKFLSRVDDLPIEHPEQLKPFLERRSAGETVHLEFSDKKSLPIKLPQRYGAGAVLINGLLGAVFFLISWIVWYRAKEEGDKQFALAAMLFGYIIAMGGTGFALPGVISVLLNVLYFLCYPQAFFTFWCFCYHFPAPVLPDESLQTRKRVLYFVGFLLSGVLISTFFLETSRPTMPNILLYEYTYRTFRAVILFVLLSSLTVLIRNLRREPTLENYRKVYWLIWGIVLGSAPFLLLWNLPQLLGYAPLLPEWLVTLWLVVIPISITIAIVKHRLFDIEIILSRSIIYFTVLTLLLIGYVFLVGGLSLVVYQQFSLQFPLLSVLTALVIALAFTPLKQRVTHFVNQQFFRIRYDRFLALKSLLTRLENCYTEQMVVDTLRQQYQRVIPLSESFIARRVENHWKVEGLQKRLKKDWESWLQKNVPGALPERLINRAHQQLVEEWQGETLHSFPENGVVLLGIGEELLWCLGKKLSGARFWKEDIDLAEQMAQAATIQLEKVKYFQQAAQEALEKEQAQQQSRWKSLLVAEVAHDLRSPLNTMLWKLKNFQQTLQQQSASSLQPVEEIRRQIEHLQALIQALLIMPQVEEGKYRIQWQFLPVKELIEEVLSHLEGILTGKQLEVLVDCPADLVLRADQTLLSEVLLNLVDNAAKFSSPGKQIEIIAGVTPQTDAEKTYITIRDEAGGIPPEKQRLLFEPFEERDAGEGRIHLGLYIAREFTRAMGGELTLKSEYGKGTEVELWFGKGG